MLQAVEKVPAGTGIVLKGDAGTYNPQTTSDVTDNMEDNLLTGTATAAYTVTGTNTFVLSKNSENKPGFRRAAEGLEIPQYKAYLILADGSARSFFSFAGDSTNGIGSMTVATDSEKVFDLSGRRVQQPARGIYVKDGRKVVVK